MSPKEGLGNHLQPDMQGWQLEPTIQQQREPRVEGLALRRQQDLHWISHKLILEADLWL